MSSSLGGISSGDFKETAGRIQLFHVLVRNSVGAATTDAFTQTNPPVVATAGNVSSTLANITKKGVLGGSIAFTRPDAGNGLHGGPVLNGVNYIAGLKPLGFFLNDAIGNAFENTPGTASGKAPYVSGSGCVGLAIYETKQQIGGTAAVSWAAGDPVYASVNGLATNRSTDAYEYNVSGNPTPTLLGIVKVAPDATNTLLVLDLRV